MNDVVLGRGDGQAVLDLPLELAAHRQALDERVVDPQLDVVLAFCDIAANRSAAIVATQLDLEEVVAVEREVVPHGQPPVRGERQPLPHPRVLPRAGRDPVGLDYRAVLEGAHGEPADLAGGRDVAFHQGRRHRQHLGVVVEAEAGHVAREQRLSVDLQVQEILDGVDVLRAIHAARRDPSRVGCGGRHPVELRLERGYERPDVASIRPRAPLRRHLVAAELPYDLLEQLTVEIGPAEVDRVEHHVARLQPFVVAGYAVAIEQRAGRRYGLIGRLNRRRALLRPERLGSPTAGHDQRSQTYRDGGLPSSRAATYRRFVAHRRPTPQSHEPSYHQTRPPTCSVLANPTGLVVPAWTSPGRPTDGR